jgi:hypothetical protein
MRGLQHEYGGGGEVEGILVFIGAFTEARGLLKRNKTFFEF